MSVRRAGSEGQASVEFALLLPVAVWFVLAVVQVGVVVHERVMLTHAAREGARIAAVGGSDTEVRAGAARASGLDPDRLVVAVSRGGGRVEVAMSYTAVTDVPLVGSLVGDPRLDARAVMRRE